MRATGWSLGTWSTAENQRPRRCKDPNAALMQQGGEPIAEFGEKAE